MLDALKTLFENDVVSEDVRAAEIEEFAQDRKQLAEAKAHYAVKMRENADLLKKFVNQQLVSEISELHKDQKAMTEKFGNLEEFVVEALSKEISEFYEDKRDLAETKVKLVKEAKQKFAKVQKSFVQKSAKMVSETVEKGLTREMSQLKEDIETARRNDFGRRLFEAFANEYSTSYMNEKSETAKLMKVLNTKDRQLAEAKSVAAKSKRLVEAKEAEKQCLIETAKRQKTIDSLVGPLSKDQRDIMTDLLESVQTPKLRSAFDKYLPAVIDGNTPAKQKAPLTEGKEITGNRDESITQQSQANDGNVVDLRRLAGIN